MLVVARLAALRSGAIELRMNAARPGRPAEGSRSRLRAQLGLKVTVLLGLAVGTCVPYFTLQRLEAFPLRGVPVLAKKRIGRDDCGDLSERTPSYWLRSLSKPATLRIGESEALGGGDIEDRIRKTRLPRGEPGLRSTRGAISVEGAAHESALLGNHGLGPG